MCSFSIHIISYSFRDPISGSLAVPDWKERLCGCRASAALLGDYFVPFVRQIGEARCSWSPKEGAVPPFSHPSSISPLHYQLIRKSLILKRRRPSGSPRPRRNGAEKTETSCRQSHAVHGISAHFPHSATPSASLLSVATALAVARSDSIANPLSQFGPEHDAKRENAFVAIIQSFRLRLSRACLGKASVFTMKPSSKTAGKPDAFNFAPP